MVVTGSEIELATPIIKALAPGVVTAITKLLGKTADEVRYRFNSTFGDHLTGIRRKSSYVRTIINPDYDTRVSDIYVNLLLRHGNTVVSDYDLISQILLKRRLIISGTGGGGKSMIMRYLVSAALADDFELVPFFVDMRDLADARDIPLLESVFKLVTPEKHRSERAIFDRAIEEGGVCLFLDGFDEVDPANRDTLKSHLDDLIVRFPKLSIVMSSRPDIDFSGWDEFSVYHIEPLNRDQSRDVIRRSDFQDKEIKEEFLDKLESGEFEQFSSFLEIPLLNTILLICYGEYLYLSEKTTSFYDQAFEVLYRRHDKTKGLRRKHFSGLPYIEFRSILNAFCYRSLISHKVSFTEEELVTFVDKGARIAQISVDPVAYEQDLIESVSLMQREGLKIFFIHRTFQEFFASKFLVSYRGDETFSVFDQVLSNIMSSNVPRMTAELDIRGLEREWVGPLLAKFVDKIEFTYPLGIIELLKLFFIDVNVHWIPGEGANFGGYSWSGDQITTSLRSIKTIYGGDLGYSEDYVLKQRPIMVDGIPFEEFAMSDAAEPRLKSKFLHLRDNKDDVPLSFNLDEDSDLLSWIEHTDIPERLNLTLDNIMKLSASVQKRLKDASAFSVFD
jgi:NACHT domain